MKKTGTKKRTKRHRHKYLVSDDGDAVCVAPGKCNAAVGVVRNGVLEVKPK